MLTETRGTIVMNTLFDGYMPYQGEIPARLNGTLISDRSGVTTTYALNGLQERGTLFMGEGVEVYEGMIVGENSRDNDLDVNCVREKKLTNMRASSADDALRLVPYKQLTLEQCIEFIADDEVVEVTPKSLRMRKKILQANRRSAAGASSWSKRNVCDQSGNREVARHRKDAGPFFLRAAVLRQWRLRPWFSGPWSVRAYGMEKDASRYGTTTRRNAEERPSAVEGNGCSVLGLLCYRRRLDGSCRQSYR